MKNWIIKNEKVLFYVLMIASIVCGVIGIETKLHWMFYVGFGITALMMSIGLIHKLIDWIKKWKK